jgi:hypothetical protein
MEELQIIMGIWSLCCFLEYVQEQFNLSYFTIFLFINTIFMYYIYKSLHISIRVNLQINTSNDDSD